MWLMKIVTRAKPRQKSISLGARMVYAKNLLASRHPPWRVTRLMLALPRPPLLVHRMTALLRARLPRLTDFGKDEPSRRCTQEPARSARRAPDNGDFIGKTYLTHGVCANS